MKNSTKVFFLIFSFGNFLFFCFNLKKSAILKQTNMLMEIKLESVNNQIENFRIADSLIMLGQKCRVKCSYTLDSTSSISTPFAFSGDLAIGDF